MPEDRSLNPTPTRSPGRPIADDSDPTRTPLPAPPAERFDWLIDWLFPPRCRACGSWIHGSDGEYFCHACRRNLELIGHPLCSICGRPFPGSAGADHPCGLCLRRAPQFASARSWACYPREAGEDQPLRKVIQKFKYGRRVSLGKPLGRLMTRGCESYLAACGADVVIPVPLHPRRLRWRGFNQSVLLAREVSRVCGAPMDPFVLLRSRETPPQTELSEQERRRNVRGAFAVNPENPLEERTVLLVDDVYTSGATVNECSRALRRAGAKEVHVLTLARAV
jgi:ComF family protein